MPLSSIRFDPTQENSFAMVAEPDRHHTLIDGLRGKVVTVVGLGKSGLAAAQLLEAVGARLRLVDQKPESELASLSDHFHHADVEMFGGDRFAEGVSRSELVVLSPGVPPSLDAIDEVRKKGVPVIGEVELASWFLPMPLVAVTGMGKVRPSRLWGESLNTVADRCLSEETWAHR
ncbi:MAG: hypothetical protein ACE1ZK_05295 [Nitrospirales bacterium]